MAARNGLPDQTVKELAVLGRDDLPLRKRDPFRRVGQQHSRTNDSCHDDPGMLVDLMIGIQGPFHALCRLFHIINRMLYLLLCCMTARAYPVFQQESFSVICSLSGRIALRSVDVAIL